MKLSGKQINFLKRRNIVVLSSVDTEHKPNVIFVEINKVEPDKIIITDNEMVKTNKNIIKNKNCALLAFKKDYSYCLKILGWADYHKKGEYFEFVKQLETNKEYSPKAAIVLNIGNIIESK